MSTKNCDNSENIFIFPDAVYKTGNPCYNVGAIICIYNVEKGSFLMIIPKIEVGDILQLKKKHPCGSLLFKVLRTGSDIRLICEGCGHDMTLPREKLERAIKKIIPAENPEAMDRKNEN